MLTDTILAKLQKIDKYESKFGDSIYKHANDADYIYFNNWIIQNFSQIFNMNEYFDFLKIVNGLNFDGLFIYSIDINDENNIFEANEIFWENEEQKKFLFFGDDSITWFCFNIADKQYYLLDKPSGSIVECFSSFFEMLDELLTSVVPTEE